MANEALLRRMVSIVNVSYPFGLIWCVQRKNKYLGTKSMSVVRKKAPESPKLNKSSNRQT